jgi:RNA polymerase sigma factor (sigma-70 family)
MIDRNSSRMLVADYYSKNLVELRAFVHKFVSNKDDAEDIVQNVFLRLLTSEKMISEVTLPCLVYTVARNLITDRSRHLSIAERYEHFISFCSCHGGYDVESIYSAREMMELLERGTAHLSDKSRKIYMMNLYGGMKTSEISKALSVNYKQVENYLGAARKEVRKYMSRMLAEVV